MVIEISSDDEQPRRSNNISTGNTNRNNTFGLSHAEMLDVLSRTYTRYPNRSFFRRHRHHYFDDFDYDSDDYDEDEDDDFGNSYRGIHDFVDDDFIGMNDDYDEESEEDDGGYYDGIHYVNKRVEEDVLTEPDSEEERDKRIEKERVEAEKRNSNENGNEEVKSVDTQETILDIVGDESIIPSFDKLEERKLRVHPKYCSIGRDFSPDGGDSGFIPESQRFPSPNGLFANNHGIFVSSQKRLVTYTEFSIPEELFNEGSSIPRQTLTTKMGQHLIIHDLKLILKKFGKSISGTAPILREKLVDLIKESEGQVRAKIIETCNTLALTRRSKYFKNQPFIKPKDEINRANPVNSGIETSSLPEIPLTLAFPFVAMSPLTPFIFTNETGMNEEPLTLELPIPSGCSDLAIRIYRVRRDPKVKDTRPWTLNQDYIPLSPGKEFRLLATAQKNFFGFFEIELGHQPCLQPGVFLISLRSFPCIYNIRNYMSPTDHPLCLTMTLYPPTGLPDNLMFQVVAVQPTVPRWKELNPTSAYADQGQEMLRRTRRQVIKKFFKNTDQAAVNSTKKEEDLALDTTKLKLSLKCPYSLIRLEKPVRSRKCKHLQCFDYSVFESRARSNSNQYYEPYMNNSAGYDYDYNNCMRNGPANGPKFPKAPITKRPENRTMTCVICGKIVSDEDIISDGYTKDVLEKVESSVDAVIVDMETGDWTAVTSKASNIRLDTTENAMNEKDLDTSDSPGSKRLKFESNMIDLTDPDLENREYPGVYIKPDPGLVANVNPESQFTIPEGQQQVVLEDSLPEPVRDGSSFYHAILLD